ncbi:MAG: hypothetical protein ACREC0_03100 [Methylocella sp.]
MTGEIIQFPRTKGAHEFEGIDTKIDVEKQRQNWNAMFTSAQFALRFCNFDHVEAEAAVRRTLDASDDHVFNAMADDRADDIERLETLAAIMKEAGARLAISKAKTRKVENAIWAFNVNEYDALKAQNPGAILFYRMGGFYELLLGDAEIAARALGIVLTKRGGRGPISMCRVPVARAEDYLNRLIGQGRHVAICEHVRNLDGSYRREVARFAKPGVSPACDDGQHLRMTEKCQ